ncbi:hypothetical protein DID88_008675 [Monilinia fructigena]|uniref:T-complex protein 1 subunit gamma n=1 Tax=Monilinia fructigena TaxID=38457 RepID=A0A395J6H9_9HELO|nr:hypothetical protein DID88_008675 [Monilinia fructigena]
MQAPVVVMNTQSGDRQTGRKAQMSNITAAKTVADIIRSCLGPKAMLKMLLDPMGGIVLTNDGHAILREIEVSHPAAKSMIELSRTQDEEVGDGTTSVIILAGEMLAQSLPHNSREISTQLVLDGVMLNKDITHPKMRRRIENPRIILLDCTLEYKKGESQTNIEISKEDDWNKILQIEEEQVKLMCDSILALKPDLVITEKGVSARATGATVVNRVDDLQESDVGTECGLFEIEKIGDEYFTFLTKCKSPKACTILLRGPSKDILNEIDRNLADAMAVARNVMFHPRLSPGGGATEMAVAVRLGQLAKSIEGVQQWPYRAVAEAMEHAEGGSSWGIDGDKGTLVDMNEYGVWEPEAVKLQSIKTAVESACLLLRVDDICSAKAARALVHPAVERNKSSKSSRLTNACSCS